MKHMALVLTRFETDETFAKSVISWGEVETCNCHLNSSSPVNMPRLAPS